MRGERRCTVVDGFIFANISFSIEVARQKKRLTRRGCQCAPIRGDSSSLRAPLYSNALTGTVILLSLRIRIACDPQQSHRERLYTKPWACCIDCGGICDYVPKKEIFANISYCPLSFSSPLLPLYFFCLLINSLQPPIHSHDVKITPEKEVCLSSIPLPKRRNRTHSLFSAELLIVSTHISASALNSDPSKPIELKR